MIYDLIIAGSGSAGAAAGYYASQAGLKVLMIDAHHPPHTEGSHHGKSRLIRYAYGEGEKYLPLLLRCQTLWQEFEQHAGVKILHPCGVLNAGPQGSEFMNNILQSAERWSLNTETLTAAAAQQRWPEITLPEHFQVVFETDAGYLDAEPAIEHWVRLAREQGCGQLFNCPVSAVTQQDNLQKVQTADGEYFAKKLLISCGTRVQSLLPSLPVMPTRKVFAWFQADGRYSENNHFPGFSIELDDGSQYYGFPAQDNALKVGRHDGGQPLSLDQPRPAFGSEASDGSECFRFLRQCLPGVGGCLYGESCSYDMSPDEDFIIDTLPGNPGCLVITGLSGHGFKFAPLFGEIASQFAAGQPLPDNLSPFSLSRFNG
ncbi:N-methyl-L-tryptophan oxidase [Tatumella citrea]|uniref:N-methyltryptophan oxidase n=1 Tax=Tatumella citrea TaxID=53336 RepID=A0A1Y0LHU1_TATCI|nr:N-methyl-L-tryptophan oxidase [Tatumella citrea]ARU93616.1 N-methyltryptophan oxidase [Tatumella citrea]ARU97654.1 N-methyltryptophan oxidase [Tatumella citrea]